MCPMSGKGLRLGRLFNFDQILVSSAATDCYAGRSDSDEAPTAITDHRVAAAPAYAVELWLAAANARVRRPAYEPGQQSAAAMEAPTVWVARSAQTVWR